MLGSRALIAGGALFFVGILGSLALAGEPTLPFGPGERFEYRLTALGTSAGTLKLGVIDEGEYEGKALMSLAAKLEPGGLVALLWEGEARRTAFLDTASLTPLRVIDVEEDDEGIYKTQVDFDGKGAAIVTRFGANKKDGSDVVTKRTIPLGVLDSLSGLYRLRTMDFAVGDKLEVDLLDNSRLYKIEIRIARVEKIKTILGEREAHVLDVEARRVGAKAKPKTTAKASEAGVSSGSIASASSGLPATPTSAPASAPVVKPPDVTASLWLSTDTERLPLKFSIQYSKTAFEASLSDYTPQP